MVDQVPQGLLASVALAPPRFVLLVRHADRQPIEPGDSGRHTALTEVGERRAIALGNALRPHLGWGLSSPIHRCLATARHLGVEATTSNVLGDPGPFVFDPGLGGQVFARMGTEAVVRSHIDGETFGCMRPLVEGVRLLHERLIVELGRNGTSGCAVSHDAIVMPLIAHFTGHRFRDDWLEPLDGIVVGETTVVWRGCRHEIPR
ncbi:histidine phosphatase family protein [Myxococcota bacterium]|nr:histidine phosphatase family protein [Myxococcota bacterium]